MEIYNALPLVHTMKYNDMPVIIPVLATGYLLTIYLLLVLAQRTTKSSRYLANSLTDAYAAYGATVPVPQIDEVERWSLRVGSVVSPDLTQEAHSAIALTPQADSGGGVRMLRSQTPKPSPLQKIPEATSKVLVN
jgi:hypothetical protein